MNIEKEIEYIKKNIQRISLWQDEIIEELDSVSRNHAYYSSFSVDARDKLKKNHPELFS